MGHLGTLCDCSLQRLQPKDITLPKYVGADGDDIIYRQNQRDHLIENGDLITRDEIRGNERHDVLYQCPICAMLDY